MPFNFGNFASGLGRAASSLGSAASRGISGLASAAQSPAGQNLFNAAKGIGSAFAPQLGQMLGNKIGGQAGQMISQMGQSFGQPQQPGQEGQPGGAQGLINQGHQMGQDAIQQAQGMAGDAMQGMINQYVPQQFQGMNAGNAGNMFGGMAGSLLSKYLPQGQNGQPGLADILGGMAGNMMQGKINQYVPQQFHDISLGNVGNYAAQQGANLANKGLDAASQYASQKAGGLGLAHGGSVGMYGNPGLPHLSNPYGNSPRLGLRDYSEMMPAHGGMY